MKQRLIGLVLVGALGLSGCAGQPTAGGGVPDARSSVSAAPEPTAACPTIEGQPNDDPGCAYYDPDKAMAENERYRERLPLTAELEASLAPVVDKMTTALKPIVDGRVELNVPNVSKAIAVDEVAGTPTIGQNDAGVSFIATVETGGCLLGEVAVGSLSVEPAGVIMDGGCVAQSGH